MSEVVMRVQVSGSRDGVDWPAPGESIKVPADEAASLVASGLAQVKAADEAKVETAASTSRRKTN